MAAGRLEAQGALGASGRGGLGENHPTMSSGRIGAIVLATLACVCSSVDVWVLMTMAFPLLEQLNPAGATIQAVAAAIRLRNGSSTTYKLSQMASAIESMKAWSCELKRIFPLKPIKLLLKA